MHRSRSLPFPAMALAAPLLLWTACTDEHVLSPDDAVLKKDGGSDAGYTARTLAERWYHARGVNSEGVVAGQHPRGKCKRPWSGSVFGHDFVTAELAPQGGQEAIAERMGVPGP
jgi:hypothetical protein